MSRLLFDRGFRPDNRHSLGRGHFFYCNINRRSKKQRSAKLKVIFRPGDISNKSPNIFFKIFTNGICFIISYNYGYIFIEIFNYKSYFVSLLYEHNLTVSDHCLITKGSVFFFKGLKNHRIILSLKIVITITGTNFNILLSDFLNNTV